MAKINYDQPCTATYTDTNGRTWTYRGYRDNTGKCIYYTRTAAVSAFDGDRQVWADLTGTSQTTTTAPQTTNDKTNERTGKGWDFANNLLNLASQYIGVRQDTAQPNVTVNVPEQRKGLGTGAVIGIVAGVAVLGTIAYFAFKK